MATAEPNLAGMTVNERRAGRGLMPVWRAAGAARDRGAMLRIFQRIGVSDARAVVAAILRDPAHDGL